MKRQLMYCKMVEVKIYWSDSIQKITNKSLFNNSFAFTKYLNLFVTKINPINNSKRKEKV